MFDPKPRNAAEALRLAKCWEKAQAMSRQGYRFAERPSAPGFYSIIKPGEDVMAYIVHPETSTCTCPDWEKHGDYCKHVLFVREELADAQRVLEYEQRMAGCEVESTGTDPYAEY
jgi:hypothetical protein